MGFIQYSAWMALPGVLGGLVCPWLLCIYFRKSIPASLPKPEGTVNAAEAIASRGKDTYTTCASAPACVCALCARVHALVCLIIRCKEQVRESLLFF